MRITLSEELERQIKARIPLERTRFIETLSDYLQILLYFTIIIIQLIKEKKKKDVVLNNYLLFFGFP